VLRLPNVALRILDIRLNDWVPSTMANVLVSPAPRFLENTVETSILNKKTFLNNKINIKLLLEIILRT